ncbi:unnamed protein product [[Actinomadura] parvosata subsp. kistnae]|uniref:Uncharacterized protein n=1 Tax=[Actinomadura] parvosata subsp. kistnae TaxID=1909395 RepID=A0A1V0ABP6_9ACTN|nr:hypothetical protein [Nonomuraea sp. ATCC 55076]AQZ67634.1 hypothetical protein BKM31_44755 [Nonomuraea sp. ATCC 55076]SPL94079.1 unnamed protein product [Actinomadura parvosata subsp. kistnae]
MATRHNTCLNPACANDNAGWGGGSTPARTAVSGFSRPFAARYTSGTFSNSSRGTVVAGQQYTVSMYCYFDNPLATISGAVYIEWRNAASSVITYSNGSYSVPARAVSRVSLTATAPANAAFASLITDNYNFGSGPADFTMVLVEAAPTLDSYFDGDSPGASWDGVPGSSASTLPDSGVTGVMAATLPALTMSLTGEVRVEGVLNIVLPPLQVALSGTSDVVPQRPGTMTAADRAAVAMTAVDRRGPRMEGG